MQDQPLESIQRHVPTHLRVTVPLMLIDCPVSIIRWAPASMVKLLQTAEEEVTVIVTPEGISTSVELVGTPGHQLPATSQIPEGPPIHCWVNKVTVTSNLDVLSQPFIVWLA